MMMKKDSKTNTEITLEQALLNPHTTYVVWDTPWPGMGPDGKEVTTKVEERMLVADAIKCARAVFAKHRFDKLALQQSDYNLLADFVSNHWAYFETCE
jgi:hypothetical protein